MWLGGKGSEGQFQAHRGLHASPGLGPVIDVSAEADGAALGELGKKGGTSDGRSDVRIGPGPKSRQSRAMRSIVRGHFGPAAEVDSL